MVLYQNEDEAGGFLLTSKWQEWKERRKDDVPINAVQPDDRVDCGCDSAKQSNTPIRFSHFSRHGAGNQQQWTRGGRVWRYPEYWKRCGNQDRQTSPARALDVTLLFSLR